MNTIRLFISIIILLVFICISTPSLLFGQITYEEIRNEYHNEGFFLSTQAIININHIGQTNSLSRLNELGLDDLFQEIRFHARNNIKENFAVIYFDLNNMRAGFVQPNNLRGIYERFIWNEEQFKRNVIAAFNTIRNHNSFTIAKNNALVQLNNSESYNGIAIISSLNNVAAFSENPYISSNIKFESYLNIREELQNFDDELLESDIQLQLEEFINTFDDQLENNLGDEIHLIDLNQDLLIREFNPAQLERFENININLNQVIKMEAQN